MAELIASQNADDALDTLQRVLTDELNFSVDGPSILPPEDLGDSSKVFVGVHEGKNIIVKLGGEGESFETEAAVLGLLRKHEIPCPEALKYCEGFEQMKKPLLIETRIDGVSLNRLGKERQTPMMWEQAGGILRKMHSISLGGFGALKVDVGVLMGKYQSWGEYMATYESCIQYALDNGFIDQSEYLRIEQILHEITSLPISQSSFLHGDFHGAHIFSDGKDIIGVIDFGYSMVGDPRWDIAYSYYFLSPENRIPFNDGYGSASHDPIVSK